MAINCLDKENGKVLAERLREAREYLGLSQTFVTKQMGLYGNAISKIEHGDRKVTISELNRFSELYRRPKWWLLGEQEPPMEGPVYVDMTGLSEYDQNAISKFAEFLRHAGKAPRAMKEAGSD